MRQPRTPPADKPPLDDCFAHDRERLPAGEALALLEQRVRPVAGAETVPLAEAHGRILAETVVAERAVPGFDNVAVDGFAFAHADLAPDRPTRLRLLKGRAAAGHPFDGRLPGGAALRVLTGAALPAGADTVLMQEDGALEEGAVIIPCGVRAGANRRRAGEDIQEGQAVLQRGQRLRPQDVGVAATLGLASLRVFRPVRVALLSTGDELAEPGTPPAEGKTYDANRTILHGLLGGLGCRVTDLGILPDRAAAVAQALRKAAASHDVVLTSGGASRGDEDHVVRTVARQGRLHFWQIAVKPGRPLAFGQLDGCVFIGLPGNPVAAVICFLRFARPVLVALGGGSWPEPRAFLVAAAFVMKKKPGRREYLRARLKRGPDGRLWAERIAREGSGILTSLAEADGLVELAEDCTQVAQGDSVAFVPFSEFGLPA
ncbi:MAG TPA: gephyrin-like molybdotransferase Glp [Geminicoccaceae bacterium]|nr:gephyrin-like molybdotransferase Glp [Geminicoccaceae bacterium]